MMYTDLFEHKDGQTVYSATFEDEWIVFKAESDPSAIDDVEVSVTPSEATEAVAKTIEAHSSYIDDKDIVRLLEALESAAFDEDVLSELSWRAAP